MPRLLHELEPLFAHRSALEQLRCSQIREYVIYEHLAWNLSQGRCSIEVEWVFTFDCHNVTLTHFELYITLSGIMLYNISLIGSGLLRARAVRFDILDNP